MMKPDRACHFKFFIRYLSVKQLFFWRAYFRDHEVLSEKDGSLFAEVKKLNNLKYFVLSDEKDSVFVDLESGRLLINNCTIPTGIKQRNCSVFKLIYFKRCYFTTTNFGPIYSYFAGFETDVDGASEKRVIEVLPIKARHRSRFALRTETDTDSIELKEDMRKNVSVEFKHKLDLLLVGD